MKKVLPVVPRRRASGLTASPAMTTHPWKEGQCSHHAPLHPATAPGPISLFWGPERKLSSPTEMECD